MDQRTYTLAPDIQVLENEDQRVLVNPANLEWIKLTLDAYRCVENRKGLSLQELIAGESQRRGVNSSEIEALFAYLLEAGFVLDASRVARLARAYLNVTDRCNLACPTCYFRAKGSPGLDPLSTGEVCDVLDALTRARPRSLVVSGGEPLLREDIGDILDFACVRFEDVVLLTNGTLIEEKEARRIAEAGVKVQVSVESDDAAIHDAVRGRGSFEAAMRGIRALREAGLSAVEIVPTLTRGNLASVPGIISLARNLGTGYHFSLFMPVGRGACRTQDLAIPPGELLACFTAMIRAPYEAGETRPLGGRSEPPVQLYARRGCGAGDEIISVGPDGSVYPCPLMHLRGMALGRLPEDALPDIRRRGRRLVPEAACIRGCSDCDVMHFCGGGCRAHSLAQNGDVFSPDPYCEFYKAVYRAFLWEWREDRSLEENVSALVAALCKGM
ncbi:MAG: radical SAM protein [Bacillota bacterium]